MPAKPRVALFVTCLVDLYRPTVGFAAIKLLEDAGCQVELPRAQTCCGQPAYNTGDRATACNLARGILDTFGGYDYVVVPSGSCGGMLRSHLPYLFEDDPNLRGRADALATKTYELVSFLADVLHVEHLVAARAEGPVTYHDSCSGLRELGIKEQPRRFLRAAGIEIKEMAEPEICCGFGGTFCVKYPEISVRMVSDKVRDIAATGARTVLAGDLGCLLNIAGRLSREGRPVAARHVAEVLSGMTGQVPPIGEPVRRRPTGFDSGPGAIPSRRFSFARNRLSAGGIAGGQSTLRPPRGTEISEVSSVYNQSPSAILQGHCRSDRREKA